MFDLYARTGGPGHPERHQLRQERCKGANRKSGKYHRRYKKSFIVHLNEDVRNFEVNGKVFHFVSFCFPL